jgi:ABC-type oligopeptide transport system substrate-binding subunit
VLDRWAEYWKTPSDFSEVVVEFVPPQRLAGVYATGDEPDVVTNVDVGVLHRLQLPDGWRVVASPAATTTFLGLNVARDPLANVEVRRAVDLAIDRRPLVAELFPEGTARPAWSLVPHDIVGFSPQLRHPEADPGAARQVFTRMIGEGAEPLELAFSRERFAEIGPRVAAALTAAGLPVKGVSYGFDEFYKRLQSDDTFDLYLFHWTFRVADASRFFDLLVHSRDPELGLGTFNATSFAAPEIDRLIARAVQEENLERRIEGLQRALLQLDEARVYVPLFRPSSLSLVREGLVIEDFSCSSIRPQDVEILRR